VPGDCYHSTLNVRNGAAMNAMILQSPGLQSVELQKEEGSRYRMFARQAEFRVGSKNEPARAGERCARAEQAAMVVLTN